MVPYILSERPDLPQQRVFELSRDMTHGEKWKMLLLDLSFVGWWNRIILSEKDQNLQSFRQFAERYGGFPSN